MSMTLRTAVLGWTGAIVLVGLDGVGTREGRPMSTPTHSLPVPTTRSTAHARMEATYGRLPLQFEINRGQTDPQVKFLSRGRGYGLFLTATEAVLALGGQGTGISGATVLRMKLVGANLEPGVAGLQVLPGTVSYFAGNDPARWRTKIPTYARVRYSDVYPGIDLVYYGNQRELEYDFIVAPGADPTQIALRFDGAEDVEIDARGDLVVHTAGGWVRQPKPRIYQDVGGVRREIGGGYVLHGARPSTLKAPFSTPPFARDSDVRRGPQALHVGFHLDAYDPSRPVTIDPVLSFSTYLGGSLLDRGWGIAVDGDGNAYVTGETRSIDFPTVGPFQSTQGGDLDAFVTKISANGSALVYSAYLGGTGIDAGFAIAVDGSGNAVVTGLSWSADFPTVMPLQATNGGASDVFVTKITADGSAIVYSTYLGGGAIDFGLGVAVDAPGNASVTGGTSSTNFPTRNPIQPASGGFRDTFVTKITVSGSALVYSTYLGGDSDDSGTGIALDAAGNAAVVGSTASENFPTVNPVQPAQGGRGDAFVAKLNLMGSTLLYSTYLGGRGIDSGGGIAVDPANNVYITGQTQSTNFRTANPLQPNLAGPTDAFVAKLTAAGSALVYSTYLGGAGREFGNGIAVDGDGNASVTGDTSSEDFPTANAVQPAFGHGGLDAFVAKLNAAGSALVHSTYLGGSDIDAGVAIALDLDGNAYVSGETASLDFPTVNPLQPIYGNGFRDAFVTKFVAGADLLVTQTDSPDPVVVENELTYTVTIANNGPDAATGVTLVDTLPLDVNFGAADASQGNCAEEAGTVTCALGRLARGATATVTIIVFPAVTGFLLNTADVFANELDLDQTNNTATETTTVIPEKRELFYQ